MPWIGARDRCALATIWTMRLSVVSSPTSCASIRKLPVLFSVPPVTASPSVFSTGTGSPVIMLSSTEERPSVTTPSTGTLSPGRTRRMSPERRSSSGTSSSLSPVTRRAVLGARSISARIASPVRSRAASSIT